MKQNKEQLKEYCSKKYFKDIVTFEEALITVLQWDEIKNALKTMTVVGKESQISKCSGAVRLILTFSNDECAKLDDDFITLLNKLNVKL